MAYVGLNSYRTLAIIMEFIGSIPASVTKNRKRTGR